MKQHFLKSNHNIRAPHNGRDCHTEHKSINVPHRQVHTRLNVDHKTQPIANK